QSVGDALVLIRFALVGVVLTSGTPVRGRDRLRLYMLLRNLMIRRYIRSRRRSGTAMVHGGKLRPVLGREVLVPHLVRGGLDMVLVLRLRLHRRGASRDAGATVEADVVRVDDGVLFNDGAILVDVGHVDAAEVRHGAVVGEDSAAP